MKKAEISIMMKHYGDLLVLKDAGFDKDDAIFEFKCLMKALNLVNEYKNVENEHFVSTHELKFMQKEGYSTLLDIVMKYNGAKVVEYEYLVDIAVEIWDEMSDEHKKCVNTCINMIENC